MYLHTEGTNPMLRWYSNALTTRASDIDADDDIKGVMDTPAASPYKR